ncbi:MAG TPA: HAMP domain-containing sensor histidine kinase, partial [Sphingomicrobium sp.]|nr:HAMP domain-containing sensor histidine kinase [Sphingomicrobium sp.]
RVQDHMQLACVAVGAFLAGSFADAQKQAIREINRRDRLLLRAERLKTLRAMSLAVIHEVSQPLSTLAIEARAMVDASRSTNVKTDELAEIAALIARKTDDIAELIRRLRGFGSGGNEGRALQSFRQLVADVIAMAAPEAKDAGITIEETGGPDLTANVNDVEFRQALLNLVRNALAAAPKPDGIIRIGWLKIEGSVRVWVENDVAGRPRSHDGMGLGLIIARTIAQAHGGRLRIERTAAGGVRVGLDLPVDEGSVE